MVFHLSQHGKEQIKSITGRESGVPSSGKRGSAARGNGKRPVCLVNATDEVGNIGMSAHIGPLQPGKALWILSTKGSYWVWMYMYMYVLYISMCIYNTHRHIYLSKYTYISCYYIENGLEETIEEAKR